MSKQWGTHPHRETQRDTHTHSSTAMHTYMHTDTRCCCCLLLRVVQTIFNTFTIIVNVCKISGIMCVWESKRGREPTQERARVCYICVRVCVCVCKVNIRFYRLLLFAGLLQHATRESKNNREGEREREGWGNSMECRCFGHFIRLGHRSQTRK